ncbi:TPA: NUDIX hydrolase [Candidatus Uhrbacteria bacterium]|nr:NUDIX hydrolase [Candidatus Uhrbacteria bacterium]
MQNVLHLGVYAIIRNGTQVLLIKKARGPYTGLLDLPGGKLEHGESPMDAVSREVMEETGLVVTSTKLLENLSVVTNFTDERGNISMYQVGLIYEVVTDGTDQTAEMDFEDSLGAKWIEVTELSGNQLSPFAIKTLLDP